MPLWRFTGIYGIAARGGRNHTWNLIRSLAASVSNLPWLMAGDFNEIMWRKDKSGGNERALAAMLIFRKAMIDADLSDVGSKNTIKGLNDEQGTWQVTPEEIHRLLLSYFQQIFTAESVERDAINTVMEATPVKVTTDMCSDLMKPYTSDEIRHALFQMHPSKSPGPDGFEQDEEEIYKLARQTGNLYVRVVCAMMK
ncbi:hypothetical protein ACLB2K_031020 [Fragaria x ananassa]